MVKYFSKEYFEKVAEILNASGEQAIKDLLKESLSLLNIATDQNKAFLMSIKDGKVTCTEATPTTAADFALSAPYAVWVQVTKGELGQTKAVMTGKMKFKGAMAKVMRLQKNVDKMNEVISKMPGVEY